MQNPDRKIDKTHLSIDQAEERGFIHRDYIAHCFRWSHIVKFLMQRHRWRNDIILDIGCGKDLPLPRLMYANKMTDFAYIGVDMNNLEIPAMLETAIKNGKADIQIMPRTNAAEIKYEDLEFEHPTVAVCLEVLEHVHPAICQKLVRNIYNLLAPGADLFVSTPVFNGSAAANHINEMKYMTVGSLLESCGFKIVDHFGTFASQSEIVFKINQYSGMGIYERLSQYYDSNVLATIFAPLFPSYSRNVIWHVEKAAIASTRFSSPENIPRPLGQHPEAEELFNANAR